MAQKVVLKVLTMIDDKTRKKAFQAAADLHGVDAIAADLNEQKLTVIGDMNAVKVAKRLMKVGKVEIVSVEPVKEPEPEKKEEKKEEKQEEKKEEPKYEKKEEKKEEKQEEKK